MAAKREIAFLITLVVLAFIMSAFFFEPAAGLARGQGTVLSDNWWAGMNWIKENTEECAVVATYWDPGHFITGIARRPVVFDGASQNAQFTRPAAEYEEIQSKYADLVPGETRTEDGKEIRKEQGRIIIREKSLAVDRAIIYADGKKTTARIQDIAATLATSNESLAIEILREYRKPGCSEMYYIASGDLIGKSFWWTYFANWNPVDKGCAKPMSFLDLRQSRPSLGGGIASTYVGGVTVACNQQIGGAIVIVQQNNTFAPFLLQDNQLLPIEQIFYFSAEGGVVRTDPVAPVKGMVWLPASGRMPSQIVFIPPEIKESMFTKMFFFDGQGLENFELVRNWGGELKLFKVKLE